MTDSEKLAAILEAVAPLVKLANMNDHVDYPRDVRVPLHELRALRDVMEVIKEDALRLRANMACANWYY